MNRRMAFTHQFVAYIRLEKDIYIYIYIYVSMMEMTAISNSALLDYWRRWHNQTFYPGLNTWVGLYKVLNVIGIMFN
jgi:hypothetical protein